MATKEPIGKGARTSRKGKESQPRGLEALLAAAEPAVAQWIQDLQAQRRSRYTVKHYALTLRQFQQWLHATYPRIPSLSALGPSELKQYQIVLSTQRSYAKNTLYIMLKAIQAFYKHLGRDDLAKALKPPRRGQGLPKYLSEAEAQRLLAAAEGPRSQALVALLLYGGVRVGEVSTVLIPDIDLSEATIRIRSGKGDKDRLVVVAPRCLESVKVWLTARPPSPTDYLFPGQGKASPIGVRSIQRLVIQTAKRAGLEKRVTPHVLRHTLATTLLRRGGDIRFIQRILGHASIATTQVYTHLDDRELKRMYDKAQPDF